MTSCSRARGHLAAYRPATAAVAALVVALGVAAPAWAADVTVTINPAPQEAGKETGSTGDGPTYNYYAFMWASRSSEDETRVSYYVATEAQKEFLENVQINGKKLFNIQRVGTENRWNVSLNNKSEASEGTTATTYSAEEVANALSTAVHAEGVNASGVTVATGQATKRPDGKSTFTLTDNAYVLVESSLGSKAMLDTFATKEIDEKNVYPTNTKEQSKTQDGTYSADDLSAQVGDTVWFQVQVTIPTTATKSIKVTDVMSKGLTLNPNTLTITAEHGTNFNNPSWGGPTVDDSGNQTYTYTFDENTIAALVNATKRASGSPTSTTVTMRYSATVNEKAIDFDSATYETNKAHIDYDNYATPDKVVNVKTFKFQLFKYDAGDAANATTPTKTLGGATFQLLKGDDKSVVSLVPVGQAYSGGRYTQYRIATSDSENGAVTSFVTIGADTAGNDHRIEISGLDKDATYYLRETEAPNGYNRLTEDTKIETGTLEGGNVVNVANHSGSVLPSTGGAGTVAFYVIGAALMVGAVVYVISKKHAAAK